MEYKNKYVLLFFGAMFIFSIISCSSEIDPASPEVKGSPSQVAVRGTPTGAEVKGFIVLTLDGIIEEQSSNVKRNRTLYVPAVTVTLEEAATGIIKSATTDLSGRFHFSKKPPGTYKLCWQKEGFTSGCRAKLVTVHSERLYLGENNINLLKGENVRAFYGKVRFADNATTRTVQPFFGVNAYSKVKSNNLQAYVSNFGWYILPVVDHEENALQASIEGENVNVTLPPAGTSSRVVRKDIILRNSKPTLLPISATKTNTIDAALVRTAKIGETLVLTANAKDPNGDALNIVWRAGAGNLSSNSGPVVKWTLPKKAGSYSVEALVSDGRGGYQSSHLVLEVDAFVSFSGKVKDASGNGIENANVTINKKEFKTLAGGRFIAELDEAKDYVLNITKPGFISASRRYRDGVTDGSWTLAKTQQVSFVHKDGLRVTQERSDRDCLGSPSERINWPAMIEQFGEQRVALRQHPAKFDKNGEVIRPRTKKDLPSFDKSVLRKKQDDACLGVTLMIPGGSLAFANGSILPDDAIVNAEIGTINLDAPDAMPGDMSAINTDGQSRFLQSFGAAYVKLSSSQQELKLAQRATIEIPIPANRQTSGFTVKPQIPVLSYNPESVMWEPYLDKNSNQLLAKRVGNRYIAQVDHFSTVNMDDYKVDPACIAINAEDMPDVFTLEMTVDSSGEVLTPIPSTIQNSPTSVHALYNLPPNEKVEIRIYDNNIDELNGSKLEPGLLIGTYTTNTGSPYGISLAELESEEAQGYPSCGTLLSPVVVDLPERVGDNAFLSLWPGEGRAGADGVPFEATGALSSNYADMQADYYDKIDQCDTRDTLELFRQTNGFVDGAGNLASDITSAVYANTVDLGFGREMYCRKSNCDSDTGECDVACYVSNYGQGGYLNGANAPTPDNEDFLAAATALKLHDFIANNPDVSGVPDTGLIATVAMEYSRLDVESGGSCSPESGGERFTKFYVYGGDGNIVDNTGVNLDGFGERPVPQLCTVCHGGSLSQTDGSALSADEKATEYFLLNGSDGEEFWMPIRLGDPGAQFLPFDLESFSFVDDGAINTVNDSNGNGSIDGLSEFTPVTIASQGLDRNGQERAFYDLNKIVLRTVADELDTHAIKEVIHKMYPRTAADQNAAFNADQAIDFVVGDWNAVANGHNAADNSAYYQNIVAKSCRTCHVSQASGIDWSSASGYYPHSSMYTIICEAPQIMPHAYATWARFWSGVGGQPEFLQAFDADYEECTQPSSNN